MQRRVSVDQVCSWGDFVRRTVILSLFMVTIVLIGFYNVHPLLKLLSNGVYVFVINMLAVRIDRETSMFAFS